MAEVESTPTEAFLPKQGANEVGSTGGEGDALLSVATAALLTLGKLTEHSQLLGSAAAKSLEETVRGAQQRLARAELNVVVVGERQSGKSTLLDAVVGDRLLGGARGQIAVPTFIRRRETASYVATFRDGTTEDFAKLVPDSTPEFVEKAERLERALADIKKRCAEGRTALRRAIEARESAELASGEAQRDLEEAGRMAGTATKELAVVETDAGRVDDAIAEVEPEIPRIVRREPPRWAVWLWLIRLFFVVFKRGVWVRYRALVRERELMQSRLLEGRTDARMRSEARQSAEARAAPLASGVTSAQTEAGDVERALRAAEKERDALRAELEDLRSKQEHYESERRRRFLADLKSLCGEQGRARGLAELAVDYPARLLPEDIAIIDMPGGSSGGATQWNTIRERADGCIFVSELDRAVSESAKQFLRQVREVMPHLLLVLTKVDNAFAAAVTRGGSDPWAQVEQARRIGTRRFARELGREPESVLSIAVAAEVALMPRESELARRFVSEIAKLFQLLRHERAIILGAHAGSAIRRCIGSIGEAEDRAERVYREKIAELESKRTPMPEAFSQERLAAAEPEIEACAQEALGRALASLRTGFSVPRRLAEQTVDGCEHRRSLANAVERTSPELAERVRRVRGDAYIELEAGMERAVEAVTAKLLQELRDRYQLLHKIERATRSFPRLGAPDDALPDFASVVPEIRSAVDAFDKGRYALGAGGIAMGAAAGVFTFHWVGALAGGAAGALSAFARRESALRKRAIDLVTQALSAQEALYAEELQSAAGLVRDTIRSSIQRSLERAILRFGRWIAEPIEAEQQAIDAERHKLAELERLRAELTEHDQEIEKRLRAAADASVGLCR